MAERIISRWNSQHSQSISTSLINTTWSILIDAFRTALNATRSPFLRLPAEIRQEIWSLYISDLIINVDGLNRPSRCVAAIQVWDPILKLYVYRAPPRLPHRLSFSSCGPFADKICHHIAPRNSYCPNPWYSCDYAHRVFHPLVCKQFWFETHEMFIGRATWVFHNHHDLVLFIKTKRHVLPHVRRLVISSAHNTYSLPLGQWIDSWQQALTWSKMRHFRRLEGVELHLTIPYYERTFRVLSDPRHDPLQNNAKLKAILRSLQQHKLRAHLTRVKMNPSNVGRARVEPWEAAWRDVMLTHVPLGKGEGSKEKKWARKNLRDKNKKV